MSEIKSNINILKDPIKYRVILWFWILFIVTFIVWASFASIDEIVRGSGKIIPSSKNQIIQNLEGGIIHKINVKQGDLVKKGDILIQIENQKNISLYESDKLTSIELDVKIARLKAQAYNMKYVVKDSMKQYQNLINREKSLFNTNIKKLNSNISIFNEQIIQHNSSLEEAKTSIRHLKKSLSFIEEEIKMVKPLVKQGIKSKVDLIKLKKEANRVNEKLQTTKGSIPRLKSLINESKYKTQKISNDFKSKSKEELNKYVMEKERIKVNLLSSKDSVSRTHVTSPTNAIVKNIFVNTIGGVIKSAENLIELVPTDDTLLVQARIKPSDIAFIYASQKVIVKFTAYDFALFGALKGKIVSIGADTKLTKENKAYYEIIIKTNRNYLKKGNKKLPIIPGMVVSIDIITGKKTILNYILKPILKTKQYAFTQR